MEERIISDANGGLGDGGIRDALYLAYPRAVGQRGVDPPHIMLSAAICSDEMSRHQEAMEKSDDSFREKEERLD